MDGYTAKEVQSSVKIHEERRSFIEFGSWSRTTDRWEMIEKNHKLGQTSESLRTGKKWFELDLLYYKTRKQAIEYRY